MAENYSHLQKLCLDTIQSGAVQAFIEFFRLTHMEQPMGSNQPQSYEDLIGTAGVDAPTLAPLFSFDSPLGMTLQQLQQIQQLLQKADTAQLENDLFSQFSSLSKLSDLFLQNHRLRQKVKMLPLVVPYPQYTSLMNSKLQNLLSLIDSPEFKQQVQEEDPLIAAVAKLKKLEVKTQTFPPITISYALKARNCLYEFIQQISKEYSLENIKYLMPDAEIPENQSDKQIPTQLQLKIVILLTACYLRLGLSLQQFNLFRAAFQVFQLFLQCINYLEQLFNCKFNEKFEPTIKNGYKQLLQDEQINMNPDKQDDNLAYASLELIDFPKLQETILDRKNIYCKWEIQLDDLKQFQFVDNDFKDQLMISGDQNDEDGKIGDLVEFVYAGRQIATMNCLQLAAQIYSQQAQCVQDIDISTEEIERAIGSAQSKELTVSALSNPQLPPQIKCSYQEYVLSTALALKSLQMSLEYKIYSTTLPCFKRFAELCSLSNIQSLAENYALQISQFDPIYEINSLAWQSKWARMQGNNQKRQQLVELRLQKAKLCAETDKAAVKYAVSAASELVFSQKQNDCQKMEEAWNQLQSSKVNQNQVDQQQIEARVRFGAVKGELGVSKGLGEEIGGEDIDDFVEFV